jgi:GDP-L-fucose synthase
VTIKELTETVAAVTGFSGRIAWDASKPDGTPRKLMDVSRLSGLGWRARIGLRAGIERTYTSFLEESAAGKVRG